MIKLKKIPVVIVIYLLLMSVFTCQKADLSVIDNLRDNKIGIIGHAGIGFPSPDVNLPSNSLESITKTVEGYAADGVEVDVQMSADGVLYLYHDARLQTLTDCLGCTYQQTSENLDECRYVLGFNNQNVNEERLVRLETIFKRFDERASKPYFFLDLKTSPDCPLSFEYRTFEDTYIDRLKTLVTRYDYGSRLIIESVHLPILQRIKDELPEVNLILLTEINEETIEIAVENDLYGLSSLSLDTSKEIIKKAHDQGLFITLGIVKIRRDLINIIEKSPDFIYTDNIPLSQSVLN